MDRPEDRLALIEWLDPHARDGRAGRVVDVHRWPLTLGRALHDTVVLDDPHVAATHARIEPGADGALMLEVGQTTNGVLLDGQRLAAGARVALPAAGAVLQLGGTRLRLRLRGETLAPERALARVAYAQRPALLGATAAAVLAAALAGHWIALDPGADFTAWLPLLLGLPVALVGWCGLWAAASKLFQHRFEFGGHLRIVLPWLLAIELAGWALPQLGAALGARLLWAASAPVGAALTLLLLRAHLRLLLPAHGRVINGSLVALAAGALAVSLATTHRTTDRFVSAPYMSTLPLPAVRVGSTAAVQTLLDDMPALRERLAERARQARHEEDRDGSDDEADAD